MASNNNEHLNRILTALKNGSILIKDKRNDENYSRLFFLNENEDFISYYQPENVFARARRYYIKDIDEIHIGFYSLTFDGILRHKNAHLAGENLAFTILYNNFRNELHLMADDRRTRNIWVSGLKHLIDTQAQKRQRNLIRDTNWILSHVRFEDKDKSNTMNKFECKKFLAYSLNVELSEDIFENIFQKVNKNGDGNLTPNEFIEFFHILTRRKDLYEIMQKYVKNGDDQSIETISMNVNELLHFLQTVQNQKLLNYPSKQLKDNFTVQSIMTRKQVQELINEYEPNIELQKKNLLGLDGFRNLLSSDDFCIMQPWCSRRTYQDMTRPLSDYFINASHNTYLFDNHGNDKNNPEVYNQALRAGCRVIEIDCYDGHDGQPVVKHEYSSIKAYPFESVIHFIEPNLFKTSPYPVILSIENHCSIKQQKEIARILKEILGNRLITEPPLSKSSWMLPSPENLKHKVLIRSIKSSAPIKDSKLLKKNEKSDNTLVNNGISDLFIYLENVPFREYNYTKDHYMCLQLPSLSEKEFKQTSHSDPFGLIKQTQKFLLRIHSDNLNNPNPIDPWNFGIQIVAVNYQNNDSFMELCHGKFLDNGKCGYILKPNYLMHSDKSKFNPLDYLIKSSNKISKNILEYPQRLIITIISGQFLYRSNRNKNDISNPYVVVSTHGIVCDKQIQKTKFIQNNGLNPLWNETFEFEISFPQMCLICFDVYDYDIYSHDNHLAYFCLPLTTIQTGYRHIYLRTKDHDSTYSSLFVHVVIENT